MNRWITIAGTLVLSGVTVVGVGVFGLLRGWHVTKLNPEELGDRLEPDFRIVIPEGEGPFPTVLAFHPCGGVTDHDWSEFFVENGYATILVDSYISRPQLTPNIVCTGRAFWGAERAGDVWTSIEVARELPVVDSDHLFLMGWSHGGWAIADLLALRSDNRLPTNLTQAPTVDVEEAISGAILMYPYCGFPAMSRLGWSVQVPSLMLLAGEDTISKPPECLDIVDRTNRRSSHREYVPAHSHVYEGADHVFDVSFIPEVYDPEATADARDRILEFMNAQMNEGELGK